MKAHSHISFTSAAKLNTRCLGHWTNYARQLVLWIVIFTAGVASGANQFFTDASGPKPWDTTTANWGAATGGPYNAAWASGNTAMFEGTAGTVNVGSGASAPTIGGITFNVAGYTLSGGTLNFGNTAVTIIGVNGLSANPTINSVIAGGGAAATLTLDARNSGASITLGGANTYTATTVLQRSTGGLIFNSLANAGSSSSFGTSGTVSLGGANSGTAVTYTGGAASTDRAWVWGGTTAAGAATFNNNGSGAVSFNNTGSAVSGTVAQRTLAFGGTYTASPNTFAGTLSDLGTGANVTSLRVGGNTWNITGANTHSGGTTLNSSGVINLGNASALGTGTFTVGGNGSFDNTTGSDLTVANAFALSGGSPTYIGSANSMTINGAVPISVANRTVTVTANTLTLGGAITEDVAGRSLTKAGSGTLVLGSATGNTHSGGTILSGGTLSFSAANQLGTGNAVTFSASATLQATAALAIPATTTISLNSGTSQFDNTAASGSTFEIAAKITGTAVCRRTSESSSTKGAVRFSNDANDYTGNFTSGFGLTEFTSVANGGAASALGAASTSYNVINGSSAVNMRYVGAANSSTTRAIDWQGTTGGLSLDNTGSGQVQYLATSNLKSGSGSATVTLQGSNTGDNTLAQIINNSSGTSSLIKSGAGKWILVGANTYSGNTTIAGGTLALGSGGSVASSPFITVSNGATLDVSAATFTLGAAQTLNGNGNVAGAVAVSGTVAPGTSVGTLTFNNSLTLSGSGTLVMELDRTNAATSDKLLGLTGLTADGTLTVNNIGPALQGGDSFTLFNVTPTGTFAATNLSSLGAGLNWFTPDNYKTLIVNQAPTGSDFATSIESGRSVTNLVIGGKHAPTDPDAADIPNLTVSSVGGSPSLGGVSTDGTRVIYTSTGATGSDSFTYTVGDGRGGSVTKTVTVTVLGGNGANIISLTGTVPNITVNFAGMPGSTYAVERSSGPSGPWSEIVASVSTGANGLGSYNDTSAPSPTGYYRTRYVSTP